SDEHSHKKACSRQALFHRSPGHSELEFLFHIHGLATGQRQVGARLVQNQIEEHALMWTHWTNDVVLLAQSDQNVVDLIIEVEHAHGLQLGTHHFRVACCSQFHIDTTAGAAHQHATGTVDQSCTDSSVSHHQS